MPSHNDVKQQLSKLDKFELLLSKKEIKELPKILWENETVENAVQGLYDNGNGLLVATNRRLIFINKGWLYGVKVEDFPYERISSIQYETNLLFGEIDIFVSGNRAEIKQIKKASVRSFAEFVRLKISSPETLKNNSDQDRLSKLEKLADLKDKGVLTNKEFQIEKRKILKQ